MRKMLPSFISKVFQMIEDNGFNYAVLRNYEELPYYNKSRDIDILIRKQDYTAIRKKMTHLCEQENIFIVSYFKSERLRTFICGTIAENNIELMQFDFFIHTSAYGHIILTAEEMLSSRKKENGVYHVDKVYQLLDKYLYLKYIGSKLPQKYESLKDSLISSPDLEKVLYSFGISSFAELENMSMMEFRRKVSKRMVGSLKNIFSFWKYYLGNLLIYKGYSIGFTGPDGSGKTTIINNLCEKYSMVYSRIAVHHFRPTMFGNLGEVAHNAKMKKTVDKNFDKPHRGGRVGTLNSLLRLFYYSIDYIVGYWMKIRKILERRELVIFDRYYSDIICDSSRSRIYMPTKFLYWFGRLFIPALNYNILLTASTTTILNRKNELDKEGVEAINKNIDYLKYKKGYYKVLNEGTPQEAVAKILGIVFEEQHKKNLKRLK